MNSNTQVIVNLPGEFGASDHHNSEIKDMMFRLKLTMLNN
ncbi:hypothetical protein SAMN04487995_6195 [Dyadobacter koreensis]|uniref:Uncharacterized protein n=1 Tax=Dyadobacter koreensis TaxID=408657 RepID=A0A1H7B9R7_9BACT|nr:hypothetical protein SAMN04487995_6195 [Dyadobacter koreensis]